MKRLLIAVVAACLAGSAAASSIDFTFGTNFYTPAAVGEQTENGTNFGVNWNLDSDISLGVYSESGNTSDDAFTVAAIQVTKSVIKRVCVGLNLGSMTMDGEDPETLVDIFGAVTVLSGSGENITGSLVAFAAARFSKADVDGSGAVADGSNVGLAVRIGF
jgi:hypothetical protein